jgi:putative ABC transport system permease protein
MSPDRRRGALVQLARMLARVAVPRSLWPVVDEELQDELSGWRERGWPRWRRDVWGAAQYLAVAARVGLDRLVPSFGRSGTDHAATDGDWSADFRQAVRGLRTRPATTLTVVTTVALAIGATTSVYSVVDGVLLRPLPYPEPDRLARVWQTKAEWRTSSKAEFRADANRLGPLAPSYYDWLGSDLGFESLGAWVDAAYVLQENDGAQALRGQEATSGLFEALGVQPILGRGLQPGDDVGEAAPVVVLGETFWRDHFGGRAAALGTDLILGGTPHTVVGVMPVGFAAPMSGRSDGMLPAGQPLLWTPLSDEARRGRKNVSVVGRLRPGIALETASDRLSAMQDAMTSVYPDYKGAWAESLLDSVVGDARSTLAFLLAAVGLVLVVAIVNIANILTVSALSRRRELALRAALGAGSRRLVRGTLVESALLATIGGACGILIAWLSLPVLLTQVPPTLPRHDLIGVSPGVVLFGIAVTGMTALLMGALPAVLAAGADPQKALRSSARTFTSGGPADAVRGGLVVAEVSAAFVLLVGASLLATSFQRLWSVERGFATEGVVGMRVAPDPLAYRTEEDRDLFTRTLAARLEELPGVSASAVNNLPLAGARSGTRLYVERSDGQVERADALLTVALESYLDVMGIPVVAGRRFAATDAPEAPLVAIVSETTASRFWPGRSAIGQRLRIADDSTASLEVVGVAADVRHEGLGAAIAPTVYLPASQSRRETHEIVLRVRGDVGAALQSARTRVTALSPTTPVRRVIILDTKIAESVAIPRFRTVLVVGLAALAAGLALLGVYGVVSFAVTQRTKEIGVRLALGARSASVVLQVVARGLAVGLAGIALGLLVAWGLSKGVGAFLYEITPTDPATYVGVAFGVLIVSAAAAFVPAIRAATVDPVAVLKAE